VLDDDQGVATEVADWSPVAADVEVASPSADRQTPDRAATRPTLENPTTAPGLTVLLGRISITQAIGSAEVSALNGAPLFSTSLLPHSGLAAITLSPFAV
jgi:hypothetical protein